MVTGANILFREQTKLEILGETGTYIMLGNVRVHMYKEEYELQAGTNVTIKVRIQIEPYSVVEFGLLIIVLKIWRRKIQKYTM